MICQVCGGRFEGSEMNVLYESVPYGDTFLRREAACCCPECGSEHISEECCCEECSAATAEEELEEGLCRLCAEEAQQAIEWMWGMLSPAQRRYAVSHIDRMDDV